MGKFLYFPVEIGAREIIPRFIFALRAKALGYSSIIGHKFAIRDLFPYVPKGIVIYKDASADSVNYFAAARKWGHNTIATDEEYALGAEISESDVPFIAVSEVSKYVDVFAASNSQTFEIASQAGFSAALVGNLRLGACEIIRRQRDDINCINTISWQLNSNAGTPFIDDSIGRNLQIYHKHRRGSWSDDLREYQDRLLLSFEQARKIMRIIEAATISDIRLTVRPHPSESIALWKSWLGEQQGIIVQDSRRSILTSFLRNVGVMGFNCATLIEAVCSKSPAINFESSVKSRIVEQLLPPIKINDFISNWRANQVENQHIIDHRALDLSGIITDSIFDNWIRIINTGHKLQSPVSTTDSAVDFSNINFKAYPAMHHDIANRFGGFDKDEIKENASFYSRAFGLRGFSVKVLNESNILIV
jgi:surface carbohydrate biosynthesis protein